MFDYLNNQAKIIVYTPNIAGNGFHDRFLQEWSSGYPVSPMTNRFVAGRFRGGSYGETLANIKYSDGMKIWGYPTAADAGHTTGIKQNGIVQWW